jgi:hypothetical protein
MTKPEERRRGIWKGDDGESCLCRALPGSVSREGTAHPFLEARISPAYQDPLVILQEQYILHKH